MPIIVDPDQLNQGTEVVIDEATRRFTLVTAGNLSNDGVTLQALYSFFKEEWKNDNTLIPFPFPMIAITPEQFEFINDWEPVDDITRKLIRTGGWAEVASAGTRKREYLGVITLGNIDAGDRVYYSFASDSAKTDFSFTGPVNEAIQIFGNATNGNFDRRTQVLSLFIRIAGKTYGKVTSTEIGVSPITYKVERFPLTEAADLSIVADDATISTTAPYTGMSITFFASPQARTMGVSSYNFGIIVNSNGGTARQVYEYIQYRLRQNVDIDAGAGTVNGLLADSMAQFVGDRLDTRSANNPSGGGTGVFISSIAPASVNNVRYQDNTAAYRSYPFVASGFISFSDTLKNDPDAIYRVFFTSTPGGNFGTANAIVVQNASNTALSGFVSGNSSIAFTFDYDGNTQGGRTAGADAAVTIVAVGLASAQYVNATAVISRSNSNIISAVAPLERNYVNPV